MFQEGDLVYHYEFANGVVTFVDTKKYAPSTIAQIIVKFDNGVSRNCTIDGVFGLDSIPTLIAL